MQLNGKDTSLLKATSRLQRTLFSISNEDEWLFESGQHL